jgi:hypothetical protein
VVIGVDGAGLRRVSARVEMGGDGHLELVRMPGAFARGPVSVYEGPQVAEPSADVAEHHRQAQAAGPLGAVG